MTRSDKIHSRWPYEGQDGHTNATRKWTFAWSWNVSEYIGTAHEVPTETEKINRWSYDGKRWHKTCPMILRSDPNFNIFFIVCPSGVNFGTVWRLRYHRMTTCWVFPFRQELRECFQNIWHDKNCLKTMRRFISVLNSCVHLAHRKAIGGIGNVCLTTTIWRKQEADRWSYM